MNRSGEIQCSITEYFKVHLLLEKDFSNVTLWKTTCKRVMQSCRQYHREDSGFLKKWRGGKAAENEEKIPYSSVTLW